MKPAARAMSPLMRLRGLRPKDPSIDVSSTWLRSNPEEATQPQARSLHASTTMLSSAYSGRCWNDFSQFCFRSTCRQSKYTSLKPRRTGEAAHHEFDVLFQDLASSIPTHGPPWRLYGQETLLRCAGWRPRTPPEAASALRPFLGP